MRFIILLPIFVSALAFAQPAILKIDNPRAHSAFLDFKSSKRFVEIESGKQLEIAVVDLKDLSLKYASGFAGIFTWNCDTPFDFVQTGKTVLVVNVKLNEEVRGWVMNSYTLEKDSLSTDTNVDADLFASVLESFLAGENSLFRPMNLKLRRSLTEQNYYTYKNRLIEF